MTDFTSRRTTHLSTLPPPRTFQCGPRGTGGLLTAMPRTDKGHAEVVRSSSGAEKLRRLLEDASIPTELPEDFSVLRSYSTTKACNFDGPKTLTKVRNMLVHPKNAHEPYNLPGLLVGAWLLSMRYGNQLLLHHIGYTGTFQLNSPNGGWVHTSKRVPWATPVKPTKARPIPRSAGAPRRVGKS